MYYFNIMVFGDAVDKHSHILNSFQLATNNTNKKKWGGPFVRISAISQDVELNFHFTDRLAVFTSLNYRISDIALYYITLSKPFDMELIKSEIALYRSENKGPLVLIGTDIDKNVFENPEKELTQLAQMFDCKHHFLDKKIETITNALSLILNQQIRTNRLEDFQDKFKQNEQLYNAFIAFKNACADLSPKQYCLITLETKKLILPLSGGYFIPHGELHIHKFKHNCTQLIKKPYYFIDELALGLITITFSLILLNPFVLGAPTALLTLLWGTAFLIGIYITREKAKATTDALDAFCEQALSWASDITAMHQLGRSVFEKLDGLIAEKKRQRIKKMKPLETSNSLQMAQALSEELSSGASVLEAYQTVMSNKTKYLIKKPEKKSFFFSEPISLLVELAEIYKSAKPIR